MDRLLDKKTSEQVGELLNKMTGKVEIIVFKGNNEFSVVTEQLFTEISQITDKVKVISYDITSPVSDEFEIDRTLTPASVMLDSQGNDRGVRFYGIPSGHEFSTLLQDILAMSKNGEVEFSQKNIDRIKTIDKKVRIRVFVTPTCPYCPKAVISAHQTAMANSEMVVAEMFEANEFGNESQKYNVSSVPHTIIEVKENDDWVKTGEFIGAYPEDNYISELMQAIDIK